MSFCLKMSLRQFSYFLARDEINISNKKFIADKALKYNQEPSHLSPSSDLNKKDLANTFTKFVIRSDQGLTPLVRANDEWRIINIYLIV